MTYYEILQIEPGCDASGLDAAYHSLAKMYHPDRNNSPDTTKFSEITDAYRVLRNPETRTEYDNLHGFKVEVEPAADDDIWFDGGAALNDSEDHAKILTYLYKRRRAQPEDAGVIGFYVQEMLKCSHEAFEFHKWYLKEKGFIAITEQGTIAITIDGIDQVISMSRTRKEKRLLIGQSRDDQS
ncbi:MAG: DnaJ domain-containing protein [Sphingomicrobium sp.]